MSLPETFQQLEASLARTSPRPFRDATVRRAALATYETPNAVIAACARDASTTPEERDAIHAALVAEFQETGDRFWSSLLLVVFQRMLCRLRASVRRPRKNDTKGDDLDQEVLQAFLEASRALRPTTYIARHLFLQTREKIFDARAREQRAPKMAVFRDARSPFTPFRADAFERLAARQTLQTLEAELGDNLRDLVEAWNDGADTVADYVRRAHASSDAQARARAAKRIRRVRCAAVEKLCKRAARQEARTPARPIPALPVPYPLPSQTSADAAPATTAP